MIGLIKAKELHGRFPGLRFPIDMEMVANLLDCVCVTWPFRGEATEVKRSGWIGVDDRLDIRERRRLIAHAVGHQLLHCGNQLYYYTWQEMIGQKQEKGAEEFAAHFLIPGLELDRVIAWEFSEITEYFGVPNDLMCSRLTVFATQEESQRWQVQNMEFETSFNYGDGHRSSYECAKSFKFTPF